MTYMHCRIRLSDFTAWKTKMYEDRASQMSAGLELVHLWRAVEDANLAFMVLKVQDKEAARQHLSPSSVKKSSEVAGVLEFEWRFVESIKV